MERGKGVGRRRANGWCWFGRKQWGEWAEGIANHAGVEFQGWNEERVLADGGLMLLAWKATVGRVGRRDNEPCWC